MSTIPSSPLRRVSPREHCPVCDHTDWCEIRQDGAVHCMRVESETPSTRGGGWWHNLPDATSNHTNVSVPAAKPPNAVCADARTRDRIYAELLALLPLSDDDAAYLAACGISIDQRSSFGSLAGRRRQAIEHLLGVHGRGLLLTIPGFIPRADGSLGLAAPDGLLVGIRDTDGNLIALTCRVQQQDGGKHYVWLSSAGTGGPSSGAPAHVVMPADLTTQLGTVLITEGAKKAHVASHLLQMPAIGMAGHSALRTGLEALDAVVARYGCVCVLIAFDEDSDPATRDLVEVSRKKLIAACHTRGVAVRVASWNPAKGKGIDDVLVGGGLPDVTVVCGVARADPVVAPTDTRVARYETIRRVLRGTHSTTPATKLGLLACYELTGYPGEVAEPVNKVVLMRELGALVCCSDKTAGKVVSELDAAGLLDREERRVEGTGHKLLALAPGRVPEIVEQIVEAPARAKDRKRKYCEECGSPEGFLAWHCKSCGAVEVIQEQEEDGPGAESEPSPPTPQEPTENSSVILTTRGGTDAGAGAGKGPEPFDAHGPGADSLPGPEQHDSGQPIPPLVVDLHTEIEDVIAACRLAGVSLRVQGARLLVGRQGMTEVLADRICRRRDGLVTFLQQRQAARSPWQPEKDTGSDRPSRDRAPEPRPPA